MAFHRPSHVIGYHGCDKKVALKIVTGEDSLKPSDNAYDWLGNGAYFWEESPKLALRYAIDAANNEQYFSGKIETPFVLGAIIELGNCLNLVEPEAVPVLQEAYEGLAKVYKEAGKKMPKNNDANRRLDCAVFKHLHKSREDKPELAYDTIRCPFVEGDPIYPDANFSTRLHVEICVFNINMIKGYFLPLPLEVCNPYIKKGFVRLSK